MSHRVRAVVQAVAHPLGGFALTYLILVLLPWGRRFDETAVRGRWSATSWTMRRADQALLDLISEATLVAAIGVIILIAIARGRTRLGLRMAIAVGGALASTEVLKYLLPHDNWRGGDWQWLSLGSFPSGHSVIVTSIALALLTVSAPPWRRLLTGPLIAGVAVITTATVTMGWHRPSDVLGSFFLATAWHRACTTGLRRPDERGPDERRPSSWAALRPKPWALGWWVLAAVVIVGSAVEGVLDGDAATRWGRVPYWGMHSFGPPGGSLGGLAYIAGLTLVVAGAGVVVLAFGQSEAASTEAARTEAAAEAGDDPVGARSVAPEHQPADR